MLLFGDFIAQGGYDLNSHHCMLIFYFNWPAAGGSALSAANPEALALVGSVWLALFFFFLRNSHHGREFYW
jgi:hypothetical protein